MSTSQHLIPEPASEPAPNTDAHRVPSRLGRYTDHRSGATREILCVPGAGGSRLVIDRDAITLGERRLVAHLAADEPSENAALVCEHYLRDQTGRWCRRVTPEDLKVVPFADTEQIDPQAKATPSATALTDRQATHLLPGVSRDRDVDPGAALVAVLARYGADVTGAGQHARDDRKPRKL